MVPAAAVSGSFLGSLQLSCQCPPAEGRQWVASSLTLQFVMSRRQREHEPCALMYASACQEATGSGCAGGPRALHIGIAVAASLRQRCAGKRGQHAGQSRPATAHRCCTRCSAVQRDSLR